eukprot:PITA_19554
MDDFTPYGDAFETTLANLEKVLERCIQTNASLSTEKCHMMMTEGIVLGNDISADGIKVDPAKIEEFDITIVDKPGKNNVVADFISRLAIDDNCVPTEDYFPDEFLCYFYALTMVCREVHRQEDRIQIPLDRILLARIFQDAKKFMKGCDRCQRMGQPMQSYEMSLKPQIVLEPFEKWALDFVGPINLSSRQRSYVLVYTSYVTKWVEAKALTRAMEHTVLELLFEDIFIHFGIPRERVTNEGPKFTSHLIQKLVEKYKIHHRITSPYHPQANGQVESTNKVIEGILTKIVVSHQRNWVDKIPEVLWAYRTTWRNNVGFSPYKLVYGKNPLFPTEFEIKTLRTTL